MKNEFRKNLLRLVLPISLQQLMLALVSFTDAVMMGFLNQDSLSAVSLAGQVQFVYGLFTFAITGGVSILAAQYWGIKDTESVEKVLGIGLKMLIFSALPFSVCAFCFPELLMKCFVSDVALVELGAQYLRAVAPSYLLIALSQAYLCVMKNCGYAGKSSLISSVSVVLNILFNWLLIFGIGIFPRMEIRGAAVATVISKAFELIWTYIVMFRNNEVKLRISYFIHNDKILGKDFIKYSLPLLGNMLGWGVGFTMYSVILGHRGSDAAAANSIASIVRSLAICISQGIAAASGIMIGAELGRGNMDKAKNDGSKLCKIALVSGIASGLIILCVIPFVPMFKSITPVAQKYLRLMLCVCSYCVVGQAVNMTVISGIFPSGGDSKFGLKCDTITMWCVTVPIGIICSFVFELPVPIVYIIINIDEIVKLPAVYKHYKKYLWLNNLTKTVIK